MSRKLSPVPTSIPAHELARRLARMAAAARRTQSHIDSLRLRDDLDRLAEDDLDVPNLTRQ